MKDEGDGQNDMRIERSVDWSQLNWIARFICGINPIGQPVIIRKAFCLRGEITQ